ncbi:DoxX family protein [Janibacter sp. G1551]|uniref:DoxX family protein n=1 Tax=Janibacter sp. G1551 TaxID=3420440 RepID=UPI003D027F98
MSTHSASHGIGARRHLVSDTVVGDVVHQEDVVTSPFLRQILAAGRIFIGFTFLWAFIDKLFGLGYATPSERAWINGGTPAQGFMKNIEGPTSGFFSSIAGPWADWLFMAGLLGVGVAMIVGAGLKLAAWSGTLLLALMWVAEFPIGQAGMGFNNPLVDSHWIEAALLLISAYSLSGDTWGLGRWWSRIAGNGWLR